MHLSPLRNSITSITTDLWRKIYIVTKQNALFKEILNFLINLRSVQINLHKGVIPQMRRRLRVTTNLRSTVLVAMKRCGVRREENVGTVC